MVTKDTGEKSLYQRISNIVIVGLGGWMLLSVLLAFAFPKAATSVSTYNSYILMISLFCMGLTLEFKDYFSVGKNFKGIVLIMIGSFLISGVLAWVWGSIFYLGIMGNKILFVGEVLQGTVAGGAATNVQTWIARGDVPLSITATALGTLLTPFVTPLLTKLLVGTQIYIPVASMVKQTLMVALLPVLLGSGIRTIARPLVRKLEPVLPFFSCLMLLILVYGMAGPGVPMVKKNLNMLGIAIIVASLHATSSIIVAWAMARLAKMKEPQTRAIIFETTTQNSGLASILAMANFGPLAVLPIYCYMVVMNIWSFGLATYVGARPDKPIESLIPGLRLFYKPNKDKNIAN